ncbi:hypothetical protein CO670_27745 [Rhizobium sp. J15]|uniref:hypothetical protein n=1 Tax=Rhizobium sp. J15 TaxID=2035450 RepID=UPI000BE992BE|nr:hypothetical protein [Rhizobium sp. J15]PDT13136.1 hypothetical protein CO670_27745 [Rhizobium sp. J15]
MGSRYTGWSKSALAFVLGFICLFSCPLAFAAPTDIGGLTVTLPEPDSGWRKAGKGNLFNGQNYLKDDGQ